MENAVDPWHLDRGAWLYFPGIDGTRGTYQDRMLAQQYLVPECGYVFCDFTTYDGRNTYVSLFNLAGYDTDMRGIWFNSELFLPTGQFYAENNNPLWGGGIYPGMPVKYAFPAQAKRDKILEMNDMGFVLGETYTVAETYKGLVSVYLYLEEFPGYQVDSVLFTQP